MKIIAADIETDGLLLQATQMHCMVTEELGTGTRREFTDALAAYEYLLTADRIVMHNGRMFDVPVMERLVGRPSNLPPLPPCFDTLLVSRLLWPDKGNTPAGGHSLEKWGKFLGKHKAHADISDWSMYDPRMLERCHTDVDIQVALFHYMLPITKGWGESVQLEHTVASIVTKQIENGFTLDSNKLTDLEYDLHLHRAGHMDNISSIPPWVEETELKTPEYWYCGDQKYRTKSEAPASIRADLQRGPNKIKRTETMFNPNSRDHIARLFIEKYNWKPDKETPTGKPAIDEEVLSGLDYPEAQDISRIMLIDKRLSQTAQWHKYLRDGRIHGDVITNGAVSGRMSHSKPNMAQIPSVGSEWGRECRDVFCAREGWVLVGADASGLELRMLAHYLAKWDDGAYGDIILNGDIHTANQQAAGLPTRDNAKTFIYGWLYGAGDEKIGQIVGKGRKAGKKLKEKFLTSIPALRNLLREVKGKDTLTGLDGRQYPVRSEHMALNTLLQGAGAIVMKKALCIFYDDAVAKHGEHGVLWAFCANVHDEFQVEAHPDISESIGQLMADSVRKAGQHFNMGIELAGEYKIGKTWAETH